MKKKKVKNFIDWECIEIKQIMVSYYSRIKTILLNQFKKKKSKLRLK